MDSSWHGLHKFMWTCWLWFTPAWSEGDSKSFLHLNFRILYYLVSPNFVLLTECTRVGMDSTSLGKTYRLMLPRHDLKLIQISFCTWVSECLTLLCLNVRIHSSCMDSTRLCRTCSLRSSQHDFTFIQRAPCAWTSERLVWSEFGLSSFCFYENMHSGWHGLDKFLLFWFILQLKQKIIKITVHFWWCFVPQVMALFTHTDRWRFVFYGLHCEQLGSDAFLQLHKNTAGDGGASHCASVQCLVKRFASQFQVAPHNHLCVKIATQR